MLLYRPILIVHDTEGKNNGNGTIDCYQPQKQRKVNMEINNNDDDNDSSYLPQCEDKGDNLIAQKSIKNESDKGIRSLKIDVRSTVKTDKSSSVFENSQNSNQVSHAKTFSRDKSMELQSDNDKCAKLLNEHPTQSIDESSMTKINRNSNSNESAEHLINNKNENVMMMINNDSETVNLTKEICTESNHTSIASHRVTSLNDGDQIASNVTQSNHGESFS